MKLVTMVTLILSLVLSTSKGEAGDLECRYRCDVSSYSNNIEWTPTSCYKPSAPYISAYDRDSYNMAVDQYNSFVGDVESYISCMVSEAKSDLKKLPKIILEQLDEQQRSVLNDLDDAKQSLSSARLMID